MKLVDILARELKVWPADSVYCVQDQDREVRFHSGTTTGDFFASVLADKDDEVYLSGGIPFAGKVTRSQWQAAVDALKAEKVTTKTILGSLCMNDPKMHAAGDAAFDRMSKFINSDVPEWNGEGLPPVGVVCEYLGAHQYNEWSKVKIFAAWRKFVFVDFTDGWRQEDNPKRFRPIRTPEQIAAEERDRSISEMREIWNFAASSGADTFIALHSAGYRKFEIVDN